MFDANAALQYTMQLVTSEPNTSNANAYTFYMQILSEKKLAMLVAQVDFSHARVINIKETIFNKSS